VHLQELLELAFLFPSTMLEHDVRHVCVWVISPLNEVEGVDHLARIHDTIFTLTVF